MPRSTDALVSRPRIALADDYEPLAAACAGLLQRHYDVVEVATSGEAALAAVRAKSPDALVLDVSRLGPSGVEVARELTRCGTRTKVMILTYHRDPAIIEQVMKSGSLRERRRA